MSSLEAINKTLQEQTKVQEQTSTNIADLRDRIADMLSLEQNRRGDELERTIEEKQQKQKSTGKPATSFRQGFAEGTGLSGLGKILQNMLGAIGLGGGLLGGMTLGGLFGKAVGRLFFPAVGAFFGAKYLDKWIDPLVDKITGDDATWTMFGKEIDASKIVSGFAGALGLIFGPKLLAGAVTSWFEKDATTKGAALRRTFLRRLGLSAILLTAGSFAGDWLMDQGASEEFSSAVGTTLTAAGIGFQLFGVKGMLAAALAAIVYKGMEAAVAFLNARRDKVTQELISEFDTQAEEIMNTKELDLQAALNAKTTYIKALQSAKDITGERKNERLRELAMRQAEMEMIMRRGAQYEKENVPEGQRLFTADVAAKELEKHGFSKENLSAALLERALADTNAADRAKMDSDDFKNMFLDPIARELTFGMPGVTDSIINSAVNEVANQLKPIESNATVIAPENTLKQNFIDMATVTKPKNTSLVNRIPNNPAANLLSLPPRPGALLPPIVDASQQTTVNNTQSTRVQLSNNFPAALDNHYSRQYMGIPGFGYSMGTVF
jgi:hypothetical protein